MLVLIFRRALPNSVLRNKALRKLFGGLATNFWYGVEEDVYLEASTLGLAVVMIKNLVGGAGAC